jgi:hypothetical protein
MVTWSTLDATLGEQFLDVAVRQPEAQMPTDSQDDHLGRETEAGEGRLRDGTKARADSHASSLATQALSRPTQQCPCGTAGCIGIRLKDAEACLTHAEPQAREAFLAALKPGAALDLRGTPIDPELLSGVLAAVRSEHGPPTLGNAESTKAQFSGRAVFSGAQFKQRRLVDPLLDMPLFGNRAFSAALTTTW